MFHRTLDDDETLLVPLLARRATIAGISATLADSGASAPELRMVELLMRWLDAAIIASAG